MLQVTDVSREFDGVVAVDDVSLDIERGELVGLIGPNGAGKTTLFDMITGRFPPSGSGSIRFEGERISGLETHRIVRKGIARTFQLTRTVEELTVRENVLVGALFGTGQSLSADEARSEARNALQVVGLADLADQNAGNLTVAQQKRLGLARAVASQPDLILVDEIASGLLPAEVTEVSSLIERLRDELDIGVFWIEHIVDILMETVDRVVVMNYGEIIADGPPEEVRRNDRVRDAYLGEDRD